MNLIEYPVPEWVKISFLICIPAPFALTTLLVKSAFANHAGNKATAKTAIFFTFYAGYIMALGSLGCYGKVFFPPLVLLFTTFPFAFFLFLYVGKTAFFKAFLQNVALSRLVQVHIFRLIGTFFIILALHDALPKWFALAAGLGDVLTAILSIWVARLVREKHKKAKAIVLAWNTFGLADIIFTAISANVLTKLSIDNGIMGVDTLAIFPFYYIPALAPPLIMFLHYAIYLKIKQQDALS
ncbi:hypothetical protein [uncultured Flavobacterium sp.]|uniref:hypothetical protein n=1 Tax=uncultured Flavobacterium sp. TaxID=165435 RepID=UPI0025E91DF7|nr:hypothetical protein [uncultured Flavobacterium sp.]